MFQQSSNKTSRNVNWSYFVFSMSTFLPRGRRIVTNQRIPILAFNVKTQITRLKQQRLWNVDGRGFIVRSSLVSEKGSSRSVPCRLSGYGVRTVLINFLDNTNCLILFDVRTVHSEWPIRNGSRCSLIFEIFRKLLNNALITRLSLLFSTYPLLYHSSEFKDIKNHKIFRKIHQSTIRKWSTA